MQETSGMNRRDRRRHAAQNGGWTPWELATPIPKSDADLREIAAAAALTLAELQAALVQHARRQDRLVMNNLYQVAVARVPVPDEWPPMTHLSVKRLDKAPLGVEHYDHLQRIKSDLCSPDCEAMEIYPAESRLADSANQYHLWCIDAPGVRLPISGMRPVQGASAVGAHEVVQGLLVVRRAMEGDNWPEMTCIQVRRPDGQRFGQEYFRALQRLKNALVGEECEAVELYPAVSPAPGWHTLWAFNDPEHRFPFGFSARLVVGHDLGGARQQPFAESHDA